MIPIYMRSRSIQRISKTITIWCRVWAGDCPYIGPYSFQTDGVHQRQCCRSMLRYPHQPHLDDTMCPTAYVPLHLLYESSEGMVISWKVMRTGHRQSFSSGVFYSRRSRRISHKPKQPLKPTLPIPSVRFSLFMSQSHGKLDNLGEHTAKPRPTFSCCYISYKMDFKRPLK